ncbi:MAG: autotransporter-associated beta strand repeat-containing protein [Verrucomicrobiota bacterium]
MKAHQLNPFRPSTLRILAALSCCTAALVTSASALTYYWDGNGATTGAGTTANAAGNWGSSTNWSTSAVGADLTNDGAAITSADTVVFTAYDGTPANNPTGGYTVTLGAPKAVAGIVFGPAITSVGGTTTLALSGANTLTIGGGGVTLNGSNADPKIGATANTGSIILSADQTWISNYNHAMDINSSVAGDAAVGSRTLTLGLHNQFTTEFFGVISDGVAGGNLALTVNNSGGGSWSIVGAANTYTGKTTISRGDLLISSIKSVGGGSSSLGAVTTVPSGTIDMGSGTNAATLTYAGTAASSSDRVINLAGATGGATIRNSSALANTLSLTSGVTNAGGGNKTLTLRGNNAGSNTMGVISNAIDLSTTALTKSEVGTWVLNGNNTFTGGLTVSGGSLTFSNASNSFDGAITVSGATTLLTFNGSNNFTKGMTVSGGTVIVVAAGALGQDVTGNNIVVSGGNLQFNANSGFTNANRTINITSGGIGIGPGGVLPVYTDSTVNGVVLGLNLVGDAGITGLTGLSFLGSFTGGTFTGASLSPGTGSTYRLGGGGGSLIVQNNVLVGANNLLVGSTGGGSVTLSSGNTFTGTTTIQNGILNVSSINSVVGGTASSSLGAPTSVATGTIALGSGTNTVSLNYTGTGETTDRVLAFAGTTGTVTLGNSGSGAINYSSAPTFTGTGARTIQLGATTDTKGGSLTGLSDNGANKTSVSKAGLSNSTWVLSGNTFTGTTKIDGGVLQLSLASLATSYINLEGDDQNHYGVLQTNGTLSRTLGTGAGNIRLAVNSGFAAKGGALTVTLSDGTVDPLPVLLWGTTANFLGTGTDRLVFGSTTADSQVEFKNPINLNTGDAFERRIYVEQGVGGDSALLSGVLSFGMTGGPTPVPAPTGMEKLGPGTLILSAANTYFGLTSVSGGKLLVNGSTSTGNVAVNNTGTLGGAGTIGGAITVNNGGTLDPGASVGASIGTLAASGNVTFGAGSSFKVDLNASTPDRLNVTGALNIGGATLNITEIVTPTAPIYIIATYGSLPVANFTNVNGMPDGYELKTNYAGGTQIAIVLAGSSSPYDNWTQTYNLSGIGSLPGSDPDFDSVLNIVEFALNGDPTSGSSNGLQFGRMATVASEPNVLTLTIAARDGATFSAVGNSLKSAVVDGVSYTIQASNNLSDWGGPVVTEVTGPDAAAIQLGLPDPDTGWSYKTFRTDGSSSSDSTEFIRVGVE